MTNEQIQEKKLNRLESMIRMATEDTIEFDEFTQYLSIIIDLIKRSNVFNQQEKDNFYTLFKSKSKDLEDQNNRAWAGIMKKVEGLKDGYTPIEDLDYPSIKSVKDWIKDSIKDIKIPEPKEPEKEEAESIIARINTSKKKISKNAVEGLEVLAEIPEIKKAAEQAKSQSALPATTTHIFKNGGFIGRAKNIEFVEGSNVTLSVQVKGDKAVVTVNSTASGGPGGGFSEITINGTIDDSNTDFTAAEEPSYLVINGVWYKAGEGIYNWSYNAGDISLAVPVGSGGSIFGVA